MKFIVDILYFSVSFILSNFVFCIILYALNKSLLELFVPIQKLVSNIKKKELYQNIIIFIGILIGISISDFFNLNNIEVGIVMGFFISLINVIFKSGFLEILNDVKK